MPAAIRFPRRWIVKFFSLKLICGSNIYWMAPLIRGGCSMRAECVPVWVSGQHTIFCQILIRHSVKSYCFLPVDKASIANYFYADGTRLFQVHRRRPWNECHRVAPVISDSPVAPIKLRKCTGCRSDYCSVNLSIVYRSRLSSDFLPYLKIAVAKCLTCAK